MVKKKKEKKKSFPFLFLTVFNSNLYKLKISRVDSNRLTVIIDDF